MTQKMSSKVQVFSISSFCCLELWLHSQVVLSRVHKMAASSIWGYKSPYSHKLGRENWLPIALSSEPRRTFPETSFSSHWPELRATWPFISQFLENGLILLTVSQVHLFKWGNSLRHHCFFSTGEKWNVCTKATTIPSVGFACTRWVSWFIDIFKRHVLNIYHLLRTKRF